MESRILLMVLSVMFITAGANAAGHRPDVNNAYINGKQGQLEVCHRHHG